MAKEKKKDKIQEIKPTIKVQIADMQPAPHFQAKAGEYHMVALKADGTEKIGTDFSASKKLYEKTYKPLTVEGGATHPRFAIKKNTK